MKRVYLIIILVIAGIIAIVLLLPERVPPPVEMQGQMITFERPKKSAHYESNTPAHGAVLAAVPINVVIDVNFDLALSSKIEILKDGKDYGVGETIIDDNKLAMRRNMDSKAPDGLYIVGYSACWPDQSCHSGHFQFVIDHSRLSSYQDLRNKSEVMIKMHDISFQPQNIRISKGTAVTWLNDDKVEHYVNTDAHPSHTYFRNMKSLALEYGDRYTHTFNQPGIYPYHCSAHADDDMVGTIIVEEAPTTPSKKAPK